MPAAYPKELKTLGDHLRKKRLDLKLLQKEVAQRMGLAAATITNWEKNHGSPECRFIPKIIEFLGYVPSILLLPKSDEKLGLKIRLARRILGLSQKKLGKSLGFDPASIAAWERGEHKPVKKSMKKLSDLFTSRPSTGEEPKE